jgi:hypothetical protein
MTDTNENQGNWNQPWLWFTLAPLILSVVLGLTMLNISFHIQDGLVTDEYSKEGLAINERIEKEEKAKELGLTANIQISQESGELYLELNGKLDVYPDTLILEIIHPIIKDQDAKVVLTRTGASNYTGMPQVILDSKRYIRLHELHNEQWVLKGEITFPITDNVTVSAQ